MLEPSPDTTLERLVSMTAQTNLAALDKGIAAIRRSNASYAYASNTLSSIAYRLDRAIHELGMVIPPHQRATRQK